MIAIASQGKYILEERVLIKGALRKAKIGNLILQNYQLASLQDWLLLMLMNGQVKVGETLKEYVQEGTVGMAAEGDNTYNSKSSN